MHDVVLDDFEGFETDLAQIEQSVEYAEERLVADAQAMIVEAMDRQKLSKADLARLLDVSKPRVTQMLSEDCKNFTLKLFARTCFALDVPVKLVRADEVMARKTQMGWCVGDPWNDEVWHTSSAPANQNEKQLVKHLAQSTPHDVAPRGELNDAALLSLMAHAAEPRGKIAA